MRADDETRTRDPHLGKVMRYQLRYIRTAPWLLPWCESKLYPHPPSEHKSPGRGMVPGCRKVPELRRCHLLAARRVPAGPESGVTCGLGLTAPLRVRFLIAQGPMAQWKSVPFTPERSLVRTRLGPQPGPATTPGERVFRMSKPRLPNLAVGHKRTENPGSCQTSGTGSGTKGTARHGEVNVRQRSTTKPRSADVPSVSG